MGLTNGDNELPLLKQKNKKNHLFETGNHDFLPKTGHQFLPFRKIK